MARLSCGDPEISRRVGVQPPLTSKRFAEASGQYLLKTSEDQGACPASAASRALGSASVSTSDHLARSADAHALAQPQPDRAVAHQQQPLLRQGANVVGELQRRRAGAALGPVDVDEVRLQAGLEHGLAKREPLARDSGVAAREPRQRRGQPAGSVLLRARTRWVASRAASACSDGSSSFSSESRETPGAMASRYRRICA